MTVDPNIKKKADDIRTKIYGKEVRESLASGIEEISSDVVSNEARQTAVENRQDTVESQWQNVVDETTNLDVVSAPEIIAARDGEANLKARLDKENQEVTAQLAQMALYFDDFGGVGDGVTDNSELFHDFLALGGNLVIPKGGYMIEAGKYKLVSNTHLIFEEGAIVKLLPHSTSTYYMLDFYDTENVTVVNPTLDGSKADNSNLTGEWGHGLNVVNTVNTTILNAKIKDTSGDGIYIGHEYWGESLRETDNLLIKNAVINGTHRNGISICGGRNITIDSPYINDVLGAFPKAGIDIEPEGMGGVAPFLENLVIRDVTAQNCFTGVLFILDNMKDRNLTTDIRIKGIKTVECDQSIAINSLTGTLAGTISISDVEVIRSKASPLFMTGYNAENTPHIKIDGVEVDEFNTSLSTNDYYNHFLTIIALPDEVTPSDVGNMSIINPSIKETKNPYFRFVFANLNNTDKKIKNVSIINPRITTKKEVTNFVRDNPDIKIVDGLNTLKLNGAYYQYHLHTGLSSYIDNRDASDTVTVIAEDDKILLNKKIKLRVMTNQRLAFKTDTFVGGITTTGKGLYSNQVGDVLELTFVGDRWMVDNIIGTWEVEE